jgi:polyhydroxyalkanoate synthase
MSGNTNPFDALWREAGERMLAVATSFARGPSALPGGCSPREPVWRKDKVVLYRYLPPAAARALKVAPVLICYALVNRPEILDLEPGRSLIERLLAAGLQVYLIDWGRPDDSERDIGLSDYIEGYLGECVRHVLTTHRLKRLNLLGVCQGGTFSLCYCALYPRNVANLITMVTPVDFKTADDLLSKWVGPLDVEAMRRLGNLPGSVLTGMFLSLRPFRLMQQKYVDVLEQSTDPGALQTFARMERWIFDGPDQAASAFEQFVRWFYQENRLIGGTLRLGARPVSLRQVRMPVLNIFASKDHIVPPAASAALRAHIGSADYTEMPVDTGHIGMYVSRSAVRTVPNAIVSWLRDRL